MASGPYLSFTRSISLVTMSRASSQEMRTYLLTPLFSMLRPPGPVDPGAPDGSKSTRFMGNRMRAGEYTRFLYARLIGPMRLLSLGSKVFPRACMTQGLTSSRL
jgi:hypothetical protein